MKCTKKEECVNNLCDESTKTCTATKEGEECTKVEECAYGQTCRANDAGKKVCIAPAKDQEKCIVETDCEIDHCCYNNKCTSYYTLADGEFVGVSTSIEHSHSLCKSGFSNENGICQTLTKEEEKTICDEEKPCKYKNGEETLTLPENCLCGYNRNGYSYCKLGSGEKPFVQYVEMYKRYYFSLGKCHLAKRGGDGCLEDILNGEQTIKQNLHLLYNAKVEALYNNRIYDADKCALQIELPNYQVSEPISQCAKYQCDPSRTKCAESTYTTESNKIDVTLADICKKPETCVDTPNSAFYVKDNLSFTCKNKTTSNARLPGEDCENDSDCMQTLLTEQNKCTNKKCTGYDKEHSCDKDEQCLVGLYCDGSKCQLQKKEKSDCTRSYECVNDLLCNNKKCSDVIHSLEAGTDLSSLTSDDAKINDKHCAFGIVYNNKCVTLTGSNDKEEEFVNCNYGDTCTYNVIGEKETKIATITKLCECGFNSDGQGYCPKFHDYKKKEWQKYYSAIKDKADNKCHTKHRFNCYIADEGNQNKMSEIKNKVINAHLFYNAVPCAESVLSSSNIRLDLISIFIIVIPLI